jgi:hypothetical protein
MEEDLIHLTPRMASTSSSDVAATSLPRLDSSNFEPASDLDFNQLPRADGGKDAWMFLAACFALEMMIWGFPFTFGVFQDYYSKSPLFQGQANIPVIGTSTMVSGPAQIRQVTW